MSNSESVQATVDRSCRQLEHTAALMGLSLSAQISAVEQLEEVIKALLDIETDEPALDGCTFMVGTYLGEIIRQRVGGTWSLSAEGAPLLVVGTASYAPVAKARKYATDPNGGDSLSFFVSAVLAMHGNCRERDDA